MMRVERNRSRTAVLLLVGALLGAAAFLLIYTAAPLNVTDDSWIRGGYAEKDIIQHYSGWLFYRQNPQGFPLGYTTQMNYPAGTAVTYTDSVPLAAILFRFLSPLLPQTFQYFGLYTLLCYMLQGASAALLTGLFLPGWKRPALSAALFVCSPIFIERAFRHTALASHFLILFSLYLYFANRRAGPWRYRAGYLVLAGLATGIHPYFLPMVFAILFADLAQRALQTRRPGGPALFLLAAFATVGVVGYGIGAFSVPSTGGWSEEYGFFTMNLNSLFNPFSQGGVVWSRVFPVLAQGLGSYDGFNYMGLGLLAAVALGGTLWLARLGRRAPARILDLLRRHWALALVCVCLTAFAISCTVVANSRVLFTVPLPSPLMKLGSIFRSSGRLFYPVNYLLVLSAAVYFGKRSLPRIGTRAGALALAVILAVQVWDISPALVQKHQHFALGEADFESPLKNEFWQRAAGRYDHLFSLGGLLEDGLFLALYAADNGMTTNDPFTSRPDNAGHAQAVHQAFEQIAAGQLDPDTLYVSSDRAIYFQLAPLISDQAICAQVDGYYVIAPRVEGLTAPPASDNFLPLEDEVLTIEDLNDGVWTHGVLNSDKSICTFLDNSFTRSYLENAEYIVCEGQSFRILKLDDSDPGWLMVTLDIPDATALAGKTLETR